jgi:hypothetical protein
MRSMVPNYDNKKPCSTESLWPILAKRLLPKRPLYELAASRQLAASIFLICSVRQKHTLARMIREQGFDAINLGARGALERRKDIILDLDC